MSFRVLTVGWEPYFVNDLLAPIEQLSKISFLHGLVGDAARIDVAHRQYPGLNFVALSKDKADPLPAPDLDYLKSLESVGVPTIRSMIQGDRVLRNRPEVEALGYATLLAKNLRSILERHKPDVVLASHDSLHSAMSLAVAKSLGIPWVALAFPVIPENLTGFCYSLTPNSLVKIVRPVDQSLRSDASLLIQNVRSKNQKVVAYRAPASFRQWVAQYLLHSKNLFRRWHVSKSRGIDRFTYPTGIERLGDVLRRSYNRLFMPTEMMLRSPPAERYAYYPLHMAPESMVDTWAPFYQNQLGFVAQLSLAIPVDTIFVIKLHFSDPDNYSRKQLKQLSKIPRLRIAHPNASGSAFIEKAALVVGVQGTSCLEAALLGKPVLIFGDSPYLHFPRTERAKRPDELHEQICRMLEQPLATDDQILESYANYMARYMPGRINDWSRPISEDEMKRYAECFISLKKYIISMSAKCNWYDVPPFACRE